MFSAMLFGQDWISAKTIERLALESREVCIYKNIHAALTPYELTRMLNIFKPDLVFLELYPLEKALVLSQVVHDLCTRTAVVGYLCGRPTEKEIQRITDSGVQAILPSPLTVEGFQDAVELALRKARPGFQDGLLALLPAKAGSGASTVAVNLAGAMARECQRKVLLLDADLHSGVLSLLLRVKPEYAVVQALEHAALLDGALWNRIVRPAHGIDVLATGRPGPPGGASWSQYHQLLQFSLPLYDAVIVDLPEVVNDATEEIVLRAGRILLVTTPELPALVLAGQRCKGLLRRGVAPERMGLIVNRWRRDLEVSQVEEFVGAPVYFVLQNDYPAARRSAQEGRPMSARSELGRSYVRLAQRLCGQEPEERSKVGALLDSWIVRPARAVSRH
jgi:pilus assembly protein CpaE